MSPPLHPLMGFGHSVLFLVRIRTIPQFIFEHFNAFNEGVKLLKVNAIVQNIDTPSGCLSFFNRTLFPATCRDFGILTCQVEQDPDELIDLEAPLLIQFKSLLINYCFVGSFGIVDFAIHHLYECVNKYHAHYGDDDR
jgi:hypothetical protein